MAARQQGDKRGPRIVAELGRPETPEETAARKAANSRRHRANQTIFNLILSVAASLAVVLFLVLVVVRPDQPAPEAVDFVAVAEQAQEGVDVPLATPDIPSGWRANAARLEEVGGVQTWYVGFITDETQFVALNQGIDANQTWQSNLLRNGQATGEATIDGVTWMVFDNRGGDDPANLAYAMATSADDTRYVLYGTAPDEDFEAIASSLADDILTGGSR